MLPTPAIKRLSVIYQLLLRLEHSNIKEASSTELGERLGFTAHTVRKDISYLQVENCSGAKYKVLYLKEAIAEELGFNRTRKACVVGLGKIGGAVLQYNSFLEQGFEITAGFDSNINLIETMNTETKLYPSYMIEEIVQKQNIELAILAVPPEAAELCFERLVKGGVKGIVNFTSALLTGSEDIIINDIDVTKELRVISAMTSQQLN